MAVRPIPAGYHTVTPYLLVDDVEGVIAFLKQAFGGQEIERVPGADGRISHAEVRVGDSVVMMGHASDPSKRTSTMLYLYVPDVDDAYQRSLAAGATSIQAPRTEFYGDRVAAVRDVAGDQWYIATHVEDVSSEELARRAAASR